MLTEQRRQMILDILKREGRALAGQLARDWNVSEDTIRRDMRDMAADGLLKRVHGGALPIAPVLPDFSARQGVSSEEKLRLAAAAIGLLSPGQMVFLDGGTRGGGFRPGRGGASTAVRRRQRSYGRSPGTWRSPSLPMRRR